MEAVGTEKERKADWLKEEEEETAPSPKNSYGMVTDGFSRKKYDSWGAQDRLIARTSVRVGE